MLTTCQNLPILSRYVHNIINTDSFPSHSGIHSFSLSVSQPASQPVSQSVSQSVSQPASQTDRQTARQTVRQSASQPVDLIRPRLSKSVILLAVNYQTTCAVTEVRNPFLVAELRLTNAVLTYQTKRTSPRIMKVSFRNFGFRTRIG